MSLTLPLNLSETVFSALAELHVGLGEWFVRGRQTATREVFWDARGESGIIERELIGAADVSDFGQGLRPMTSYCATIISGPRALDARCRIVLIVDPPPINVWFPNSVELHFDATSGDALLITEVATRVLRSLADAMAPWWGVFDIARAPRATELEMAQARPRVGRVTYLSAVYGSVLQVPNYRSEALGSGTILRIDEPTLSRSDAQEALVNRARQELLSGGFLLRRDEVENLLTLASRSSDDAGRP